MLNKMTLQGRMVRDAELRQTQSGTKVAIFTVAWSEKYKDYERKLFLDCVAWGQLGEFVCLRFSKGQELIVEGYLSSRIWQDKEGKNRATTELIVDKVHFCGPKAETSAAPELTEFAGIEGFQVMDDESDLPF